MLDHNEEISQLALKGILYIVSNALCLCLY